MTPDSTIRRALRLRAQGLGVKEIADRMGVTDRTVRRYFEDARHKYGNAPDTTTAVARFVLASRPIRRRRCLVVDGQLEMIG